MRLEIRAAVIELKKRKQTAQYVLFREFCNTDMSVERYLNEAEKIDRKFGRDMAELLLEEVFNYDKETT